MQEFIRENINPVFASTKIGKWLRRLATAADVTNSDARTVGDLILEHDTDGVVEVDEAAT